MLHAESAFRLVFFQFKTFTVLLDYLTVNVKFVRIIFTLAYHCKSYCLVSTSKIKCSSNMNVPELLLRKLRTKGVNEIWRSHKITTMNIRTYCCKNGIFNMRYKIILLLLFLYKKKIFFRKKLAVWVFYSPHNEIQIINKFEKIFQKFQYKFTFTV